MAESSGVSYDVVPYESQAFHETHPDNLATLARLFGLEPPPVGSCRVLELGCASGGNLIPMAIGLPGASLLGIDLSARQIADGRATIERLGLTTIELRTMGLEDIGPELGTFDYILAHGVYSWLSPAVRDRLLAICAANLAPNGLAFVSYNVFPGWHLLGMLREMMRYHVAAVADPMRRAAEARAFLDFLVQAMPDQAAPYVQSVRREVEQFQGRTDSYILHEYLEEYNDPLYYHQFVAHAAAHGLRVLADARFRTAPEGQAPDVRAALDRLAGDDPDRREQYLDFLRNWTFRRSVLVPASARPRRRPDPAAVVTLRAQAAAAPVSPVPDIYSAIAEEFRTPDGQHRLATANPVIKAALWHLSAIWSRSMPVRELHARVLDVLEKPPQPRLAAPFNRDLSDLADALLQCYMTGLLNLRTAEPPSTTMAGQRPTASPYARLQAETSNRVTNLQHRVLDLSAFERLVLRQLDGTRDRAEIVDALVAAAAGEFPVTHDGQPIADMIEVRQVLGRSLDPCLTRLTNSALLVD